MLLSSTGFNFLIDYSGIFRTKFQGGHIIFLKFQIICHFHDESCNNFHEGGKTIFRLKASEKRPLKFPD